MGREARDIRDMCPGSADEMLCELEGRVDVALGRKCQEEEPVLHHGGRCGSGGARQSLELLGQYWGFFVLIFLSEDNIGCLCVGQFGELNSFEAQFILF